MSLHNPLLLKQHAMVRISLCHYEFDARAIEIVIMDRRGHVVWAQQRLHPTERIQWKGFDTYGQMVEVGDYICKVQYPDGASQYIPFVFAK